VKIAFVSDVHVGNHQQGSPTIINGINIRCQQVIDVLRRLMQPPQPWGRLTIAGDLFDTSAPSPQIVAGVARALSLAGAESVSLMVGNHDGDSPGKHALCVYEYHPSVRAVHQWGRVTTATSYPGYVPPRDGVLYEKPVLHIPFEAVPAAKYIEAALATNLGVRGGVVDVIAIHAGVRDGMEPPWLSQSDDSIALEDLVQLCKKWGIKACFAGNWHSFKRWERDGVEVLQMGALAPTGWDNPGFDYGHVGMYDTITGEVSEFALMGPRFATIDEDADEDTVEKLVKTAVRFNKLVEVLYLRVSRKRMRDTCVIASIDELKDLFDVHVTVKEDAPPEQSAVRAEAKRLRSAEDLPELVDEYIKEMKVRNDDDRAPVRAIVREALGI
jgi:hypothetical protein